LRRLFLSISILLLSAALPSPGHPQSSPNDNPSTCDTFRAAKSRVYGFHPAQLDEAQIDAKGKELDANLTQEQPTKAVADSEPIYGIANHTAFLNSAVATLPPEDFNALQDARRKTLFDVSDESLEEYLAFTQLMIRLINKLDLYKAYRTH
jgi:hypothetical protein